MSVGSRVYAKRSVRYMGTTIIHKGGKGTVACLIGSVPYVRWDWTGETYPADAAQLGRVPQ